MRYLTFQRPGGSPEPGVLLDDKVVGLRGTGFHDLISVMAGGAETRALVENWIYQPAAEHTMALSEVTVLAPVPRPSKLICVGLNYRDHAIESNMEIPKVPTLFSKFSSAVIGPGANIVLPKNSAQPDYEAEFAFVIGMGGRHIAAGDWKQHVFGYTMINDVSARDIQLATTQWLMGKTFDTFAPMGPYIVTADEIQDPHALDITMRINGELLQSSNTRELIFKIPELIAYISSVVTLEPGDVVSTGTPAGVGFARKPPRYLRPGDDVIVKVDQLGELRNPVVAEA